MEGTVRNHFREHEGGIETNQVKSGTSLEPADLALVERVGKSDFLDASRLEQ